MSLEADAGLARATTIVEAMETAWNTDDADGLVALCTEDCHWRTQAGRPTGRREILDHILDQSTGRLGQRVSYRLDALKGRRVSVALVREWRDAEDGGWRRVSGTEVWRLDDAGLIEDCVVTLGLTDLSGTGVDGGPGSSC